MVGSHASATIQNRPGPQILATYTVNDTLVQNLGRNLSAGTASTGLIAPGTLYGDRFTQMDVRFGKNFRWIRRADRASVDLYNLLNSSAVLTRTTRSDRTGGRPRRSCRAG